LRYWLSGEKSFEGDDSKLAHLGVPMVTLAIVDAWRTIRSLVREPDEGDLRDEREGRGDKARTIVSLSLSSSLPLFFSHSLLLSLSPSLLSLVSDPDHKSVSLA
jgi:hypothetical protein